jgi:pimeloyl-ACP methyl ester carboxylesterase
VRWRVAGEGAPLVCVHGLAGSWRWWRAVVPRLAAVHEVHLVDLPRFASLARGRPGDAADWLVEWLAAARIERPVLVGHSLGGLLAAQAATRVELDRLVLVDAAGLPTGRGVREELLALVGTVRAVTPSFLVTLTGDALRWGPWSLYGGARYALATDLTADLGRIEAPTLVVWGERDELVPVRLASTWREAIPGARLVVIPHAAHVPMIESPAAFTDALLEFLGQARDEGGVRPVDRVSAAPDDANTVGA